MKYEQKKIKDICRFIGGSQPPKSEFIYEPRDGYVRLIQTRDRLNDDFITFIPQNSTTKFCVTSDILIGRYGPPIFQIFRGFEGAYNVAIMKADPINGVNKDYLYYFLLQDSVLKYVDSMSARTGGQTGVELDSLYEYPVLLPDALGQKKISSILKCIDDKITNNNKIRAELESMAKTIYDYWFTQFDFPNEDGKPYRSSGGIMEWNEQLKCEIPKGWNVTSIGKVTRNYDSKRIPLSQNERDAMKGDIPYYGATGIMDYINRYIFDGHFVLIAEDGSVMDAKGNPIVQMIWGKTWVNNHSHVLQGYNGYSNELLYLLLQHIPVVKIMTGSIQKKINQDNLNSYKIPQIPGTISQAFHEIVKPMFEKIRSLQRENDELTKLRNWLLPMLMNGQATVE